MRFCPHCGSDLSMYLSVEPRASPVVEALATSGNYDQVRTWKRIAGIALERRGVPPAPEVLVRQLVRKTTPGPHDTIVHLAFDRDIVPHGGVLRELSLLEGRIELSRDILEARGYAVGEDDKIVMVEEFPVGPAFQALEYWGGDKQHARWHFTKPIKLEPTRNGDPFFMDDNMIAFGATWRNLDKFDEAFYTLIEMFLDGVKKAGRIAVPLVLEVFWRS